MDVIKLGEWALRGLGFRGSFPGSFKGSFYGFQVLLSCCAEAERAAEVAVSAARGQQERTSEANIGA